jgi:hypothetical protein
MTVEPLKTVGASPRDSISCPRELGPDQWRMFMRPSSARMYASLFFLKDMKFFSAMGRRLDNVIGGHRLQASGK